MLFKSFTLENYHSPDRHHVKEGEENNNYIVEEIKRKARFDDISANSALEIMDESESIQLEERTVMSKIGQEFGIIQFIYLYRTRNGKLKYGLLTDGSTVYFE